MSSSVQPVLKAHHHERPMQHHQELHCDPYNRASSPHTHHSHPQPVNGSSTATGTQKASPLTPSPTRPAFQVTPELQKKSEDTIKEILDRLEKQRQDGNGPSDVPSNEEDQQQQQTAHHSRRLTPDFLKEGLRSTQQHHGDANLRHG